MGYDGSRRVRRSGVRVRERAAEGKTVLAVTATAATATATTTVVERVGSGE